MNVVRVGLVTLGCDKNTVDSERYLAELLAAGAEHTDDLYDADVIVVNTCGFIDAAKKESIDALVTAGAYKTDGRCRAVVAVGCMVERHRAELAAELPEVDAFLGTTDADRLLPVLQERGILSDALVRHPGVRVYTGDLPHVRYLKVSEGCDHGCAFCAIPLMRGRHRSFAADDVVREAQLLEAQGACEINLVAQDLAHYGRDRRDGVGLAELLQRLVDETAVPWYRLLYLYSFGLTPAVLDVMARSPRIVPYLDMPIQHASDRVLERMRRPERRHTIAARVARVRERVPDIAIRTTCIVGFPGETERDVEELFAFLEEMRFDRVGAFAYSEQDGTRAAAYADDVPEAVKLDRLDRLTQLQRDISAERLERFVGRTVPVLVDRAPADGAPAQGRTRWQADDVDGVTWLAAGAIGASVRPGAIVDAVLDDVVDDEDYRARVVSVRRPAPPQSDGARWLPVLAGPSGGWSFGR
ncbi:MAG TPA: 30S ribosomal protein S12 methylthiotransferase RimO [Gemmatimonadaceae bacterium]|nr:30S ribosomal protein S12 methylthiotransferase RimO [Gemmatimonadaceae bacterium]